jgi:hypothetical protein
MNDIPKFLGTPEIAGKSRYLNIAIQRLSQKKQKKIKTGKAGLRGEALKA